MKTYERIFKIYTFRNFSKKEFQMRCFLVRFIISLKKGRDLNLKYCTITAIPHFKKKRFFVIEKLFELLKLICNRFHVDIRSIFISFNSGRFAIDNEKQYYWYGLHGYVCRTLLFWWNFPLRFRRFGVLFRR